MSSSDSDPRVHEFIGRHALELPGFAAAAESSGQAKKKIRDWYPAQPFPPDANMVVFGSLARMEYSPESDLDWTLLIDGQADPQHLEFANDIRKKVREADFGLPGKTGIFGNTTISHEVIHYIGGEFDTNRNITQRLLLLLESEKITFIDGTTGASAYDRVIAGIINQYVRHDSGIRRDKPSLPRFLLNDLVRFWRTMCVDFAYKQKEQAGEKWALRNIKLRMSRKVIYVKGLLMCFSCYETHKSDRDLAAKLLSMVPKTAFELLILYQDHFNIPDEYLLSIFSSYDKFLSYMSNSEFRGELNALDMKSANMNQRFNEMRAVAEDFRTAIDSIFIYNEGLLRNLTLKYAIF